MKTTFFGKILSCLFILSSLTANAQYGFIDSTFNQNDSPTVYENDFNLSGSQIYDSHIFPNGKYLFVGQFISYQGNIVNRIARVDNDFILDQSFLSATGSGADSTIYAAQVLTNGKIFIYGDFTFFNGIQVNGVALLNSDGSLDTNFNFSTNPFTSVSCAVIQSNDLIVLSGPTSALNPSHSFRRVFQDGSIDTTFQSTDTTNAEVTKLEVDSSDRIYPFGLFTSINSHNTYKFGRLSANGIIDTSYSIPIQNAINSIDIYVNDDGSLLLTGGFNSLQTNPFTFCALFTNTGQLDTNFYYNGMPQASSVSSQVTKDNLGRYYIRQGGGAFGSIVRLLPSGNIDTTYAQIYPGIVHALNIGPNNKVLITGNGFSRRNENGTIDLSHSIIHGPHGAIGALKKLPDDKMYLIGKFYGYSNFSSSGICRIFANGEIDTTFNPNRGIDIQSLSSTNTPDITTIEVQSDGKVLLGGNFLKFNGLTYRRLVRLFPSGDVDTSFNIGTGIGNLLNSTGIVYDIAVQPDGKIVVAGDFNFYDFSGPNQSTSFNIMRLNTDGSKDLSFNAAISGSVYSLAIQGDGKILAAGLFTTVNGLPKTSLCRINPDGTLDNSFPNSNWSTNNITYDVQLINASNILITTTNDFNGGNNGQKPIRLFPDGSVDPSLDINNNTIPNLLPLGYIKSVLPDGSMFIVGLDNSVQNVNADRLMKLDANGILDTTFTYNHPGYYSGFIRDAVVQTNGRVIVGGEMTSYAGQYKNNILALTNDSIALGCQNFASEIQPDNDLSCTSVSSTTVTVSNGTPPYSYSWNNSGFIIDDTVFTTTTTGIYNLSIIDSAGCNLYSTFLVNGPVSSDLDLSITTINGIVFSGVDASLQLIVNNEGCTPGSGIVKYEMDTLLNFVSSTPVPDSIIGNFYYWSFDSLTYDSSDFVVNLEYNTNVLSAIGDSVHFNSCVLTDSLDTDSSNNFFQNITPVINSYDPNNKGVYPIGDCYPHYISDDQKLKYIVRFQNTGNAPAFNVFIADTISEFLDLSSLHIVAKSHEMSTEFYPENEVRFVFNNINLADSASDPDGSIGYVIFEINPKSNLFDESVIKNKVGIYFDFNPPIITNEVFNTIHLEQDYHNIEYLFLQECDSILWQGQYLSQEGNYAYIGQNQYGCDSIIQLSLVVNQSNDSTLNLQACDTLNWNGQTLNQTGIYTYQNQTIHGCDSIVTLNLTVNNSVDTLFSIQDCDSALWNGQYIFTSGYYSDTSQTSTGCDSIINLNLNISNSVTANLTVNGIDSVTINGQVYYSSGIFNQTITSQNGCDSLLIIDVSLNFTKLGENSINDLIIVPNPNNGTFRISGEFSELTLTLVDPLGKLIIRNFELKSNENINLKNIQSGIYIVILENEFGRTTQRLVIK